MEGLLHGELERLSASAVRETVAGVHFRGTLADAYRVCMWSRLATGVLLRLAEFDCDGPDALYEGARAIPWAEHLGPDVTFAVAFSGRAPRIVNTQFGAQRVKDAVVDVCRERYRARPSVDRADPDLRIVARVHRGRAVVSLNLAGESLHRRGYRRAVGRAPLKENLAAALVLRAGWPQAGERALIDPMCGSGTLLIEAAEIALDLPPGRRRAHFGFEAWLGHSPEDWAVVAGDAAERTARALAQTEPAPTIIGCDASARAVEDARTNVAAAGLARHIVLERRAVADVHLPPGGGLVLTNPPYGERIGDVAALVPLYQALGGLLASAPGWRAGVFTANPDLGRAIGRRARRRYRLWNGALAAQLLLFDAPEAAAHAPAALTEPAGPSEPRVPNESADPSEPRVPNEPAALTEPAARGGPPAPRISPAARMFANRLAKRDRRLRGWAARQGVSCYRVYDADLPDYAVAIDRYADWVHVAEYKAPASVDPRLAERRLTEVVLAIPSVLEVPSDRIVVKQRARQRGAAQYQRRGRTEDMIEVEERPARFLVNLRDYLDTGIFLDHRRLRRRLGTLTEGKRFLNLFCYTATATVHAALGGATRSVSVDLSATYLEWARRNFRLNRIDERRHLLVRADGVEWLRGSRERFDLILLDPPTFSNSKRTDTTLDLLRDHRALIEAAGRHLAPDGLLVFSANRRRFVLDPGLAERFAIENVSGWSTDEDFAHARNRHHCWFLRPAPAGSRAGDQGLSAARRRREVNAGTTASAESPANTSRHSR